MSSHHFARLLWSAAGVVEAPVDDVADLVLRAEAGDVHPDSCIPLDMRAGGSVQSQVHAFVSRIGQRLGCGVRPATAAEWAGG